MRPRGVIRNQCLVRSPTSTTTLMRTKGRSGLLRFSLPGRYAGRIRGRRPRNTGLLGPLMALESLAVTTERISLIATASTSYTEPFKLARQPASLDHASDVRTRRNIVTTLSIPDRRNFS